MMTLRSYKAKSLMKIKPILICYILRHSGGRQEQGSDAHVSHSLKEVMSHWLRVIVIQIITRGYE